MVVIYMLQNKILIIFSSRTMIYSFASKERLFPFYHSNFNRNSAIIQLYLVVFFIANPKLLKLKEKSYDFRQDSIIEFEIDDSNLNID